MMWCSTISATHAQRAWNVSKKSQARALFKRSMLTSSTPRRSIRCFPKTRLTPSFTARARRSASRFVSPCPTTKTTSWGRISRPCRATTASALCSRHLPPSTATRRACPQR
eukprot:27069_2